LLSVGCYDIYFTVGVSNFNLVDFLFWNQLSRVRNDNPVGIIVDYAELGVYLVHDWSWELKKFIRVGSIALNDDFSSLLGENVGEMLNKFKQTVLLFADYDALGSFV